MHHDLAFLDAIRENVLLAVAAIRPVTKVLQTQCQLGWLDIFHANTATNKGHIV